LLNAFGTCEHLSHRTQLFVFIGLEFRAIQLAQLKGDQLLPGASIGLGPAEIGERRGQPSHVIKGGCDRCR
jgi:hypothetical protein